MDVLLPMATADDPMVPPMDDACFLRFCRLLAGRFSNRDQAAADPVNFAHIHVGFHPLEAQGFGPGWYYSEQAYDYDLWSPYRQGVHRLVRERHLVRVENYGLGDPVAAAGASRDAGIRASITPDDIKPRHGCAMEFRAVADGTFSGQVEPGCRCLVPRDGALTYLVSEVELGEDHWISRDRGFDPETHQQRWGSEHGPLRFRRIDRYDEAIGDDWLGPQVVSNC